MTGRKPKSLALKLLTGNPGKGRLNYDEPKPDPLDGIPPCPKWLKRDAKREWQAQISYLCNNRVLGKNEISMLASYCYLQGEFIKEAKAGRIMIAAMIGQMRALASELGIGPSSRSRIKAGNAPEEQESKRFFGT